MIKNNQHIFNKIQVLIDAVMIVGAYVLAWHLRFQGDLFVQDAGVLSKKVYMSVLFYIVPIYLILYYICQLYTPRRSMSRRKEVWNIFRANSIGITGFILILYLVKQEDFSRQMLFMFWGLNILMEIMSRYAIRYVLWNMRKQGFNQKHILMIGNSGATVQYLERIKSNPHWGYQVIGILTNTFIECETICGVSVIGKIDELQTVLEQHKLDEIVITLGMEEANQLEIIVDMCERNGVHTKFIPDYGNVIPTRPHIEDVQGIPVINIRNVPLKQAPNHWIKRIIDVIGALFAIVLFSPIMLVTAIIVKITMEGSVIFKQKRVGLQGKEFCMYKFRSMIVQDAESEKKAWSQVNDPRITPVGSVIRRTSIDELPQLFNVLKGEMSLVGPRPERPQFVEKFKNEIPRYMIKHQVRPGMTGWAQVNGYRGDTSIKKRIEHDLYYIENWSLGLDMKILIMTFFKGFSV